ncbi:MAG TPA: hypothetical protein VEC99_03920, partial [Clostridia bacterium]|nr:hypothetical protein [Clostridia bacterium]
MSFITNVTFRNFSLKRQLLLLPVLFCVGLLAVECGNLYLQRQVQQKVIFTNLESQILEGHTNVLKATVEI